MSLSSLSNEITETRQLSEKDKALTRPIVALGTLLRSGATTDNRAFLSDSDVETLCSFVSAGIVHVLDITHTQKMATSGVSERPVAPFGKAGTTAFAAHRREVADTHAQFFAAPLIALPLSGNGHFSVLVFDTIFRKLYHFDSLKGLHDTMVWDIVVNQCSWMLPGIAPEQAAASVTKLHHTQERTNCGISVTRVVQELENCILSGRDGGKSMEAMMAHVFDVAVADDRAVDEFRVHLAQLVSDFSHLHMTAAASHDRQAETTASKTDPLQYLLPAGMSVAAVRSYLHKEAVEGRVLATWLRQRYAWFTCVTSLSNEIVAEAIDAGKLGLILLNCDSVTHTVTSSLLALLPSESSPMCLCAAEPAAICLNIANFSTPALYQAVLDADCLTFSLPVSVDRVSSVIAICNVLDAQLWAAGSNQRGWLAQHAEMFIRKVAPKIPVGRTSQQVAGEYVMNNCYGTLARTQTNYMNDQRAALASPDRALPRIAAALSRPAGINEAQQRSVTESPAMALEQEALYDIAVRTRLPFTEICVDHPADIYDFVANTPSMLELLRRFARFIDNSCIQHDCSGYAVNVTAAMAPSFPMVFSETLANSKEVAIESNPRHFASLIASSGFVPLILPVWVFCSASGPDASQYELIKLAWGESASSSVSSAPARRRKLRVMPFAELLKLVDDGTLVVDTNMTMPSPHEKSMLVHTLGSCVVWKTRPASDPGMMAEYTLFSASLQRDSLVRYMTFQDNCFPHISVFSGDEQSSMQG